MLKNYLKTTWRGMRRNPGFSVINILGLSLGLFVCFMILLWVQDERSFDAFHKDLDRVQRVMRTATFGSTTTTTPSIPANLDDVLDEEFPEIDQASLVSWQAEASFSRNELAFRKKVRYVGPDFLDILTFPLIAGDPETALDMPESIVLTENMARTFFPEAYEAAGGNTAVAANQVVGQTVNLEKRLDLTVTGVALNPPTNTDLGFDALLTFEEFRGNNDWVEGWGNNGFRMFVKLSPGSDPDEVSDKIRTVVKDHRAESTAALFLQPISEMHLYSEFDNGVQVGGRIEYVRIMSVVAFLILIVAAINFTNLATARSSRRALEIGIRKTFGGSRRSLAMRFIGESVVTASIAFVVAMVALWLSLPAFNALTEKAISMDPTDTALWLRLSGIVLATGLLAGLYPALYLSGIGVIRVLKRDVSRLGGRGGLRRALVVFQFGISVVLIVGTITVYRQIDYIRNKNIGIDRENVFAANLEGGALEQFSTFRQRIVSIPGVLDVSTGWYNPFDINTSTSDPEYDGKDPDDNTRFYTMVVGYDFIETMGMELLSGRDFSRDVPTDTANVIVNQAAARQMGLDDPVGHRFDVWGKEGVVVGMVKNFHMASLYSPIEPVFFELTEGDPASDVFVRMAPGQTREVLARFEETYREFSPGFPYEYRFLDAEYDAMYRSEQVIGTLANWFALFAIVIACLGLYGLAAFTTERRIKEIGIRKSLGASVSGVVLLLTKEFLVLVGVAFLIAAPLGWYVMRGWLADFEFHVDLGAGIFLGAAGGLLLITCLTVGYRSIRAALINPAETLRIE